MCSQFHVQLPENDVQRKGGTHGGGRKRDAFAVHVGRPPRSHCDIQMPLNYYQPKGGL